MDKQASVLQEVIVRNHSVFGLCNRPQETFDAYIQEISRKSRDELLKERMNEQYTFFELEKELSTIKNDTSSNDIFLKFDLLRYQSKRGSAYGIRILDSIFVYRFVDLERQMALYGFPWVYPNSIVPFGTPQLHSRDEVIHDFLHLPYLGYYFKYVLHKNLDSIYVTPKCIGENMYALSNTLGVSFGWHIDFYPLNQGTFVSNAAPEYIADTWYYTDEEILYDLTHLPALDFGERYHTVWVG